MGSVVTQASVVPVDWPRLRAADLYACHFAEVRGGDFFDVLAVGGRVLFLLMDVAGPQQKAREVTAKAQTIFRQSAQELFSPAEINESDALAELAHAVNVALVEAAGGVRFSPAFLGCFNDSLGILTYCNGGNLLAILRDGSQVSTLESSAMPLGLFTHITFEASVLALQAGDALLVTTKGVSQSKRGKEEFGAERIAAVLAGAASLSAEETCRRVLEQAHEFARMPWWKPGRKHNGLDDMTALTLVRTPTS